MSMKVTKEQFIGVTYDELLAENAKLQNDADLLRSMLQAKRKDTHALMSENAELRETLQRRTKQFEGMAEMWVERGVENFKLRELVRDMWRDGMCECDERGACAECEYHFPDRMSELGAAPRGAAPAAAAASR